MKSSKVNAKLERKFFRLRGVALLTFMLLAMGKPHVVIGDDSQFRLWFKDTKAELEDLDGSVDNERLVTTLFVHNQYNEVVDKWAKQPFQFIEAIQMAYQGTAVGAPRADLKTRVKDGLKAVNARLFAKFHEAEVKQTLLSLVEDMFKLTDEVIIGNSNTLLSKLFTEEVQGKLGLTNKDPKVVAAQPPQIPGGPVPPTGEVNVQRAVQAAFEPFCKSIVDSMGRLSETVSTNFKNLSDMADELEKRATAAANQFAAGHDEEPVRQPEDRKNFEDQLLAEALKLLAPKKPTEITPVRDKSPVAAANPPSKSNDDDSVAKNTVPPQQPEPPPVISPTALTTELQTVGLSTKVPSADYGRDKVDRGDERIADNSRVKSRINNLTNNGLAGGILGIGNPLLGGFVDPWQRLFDLTLAKALNQEAREKTESIMAQLRKVKRNLSAKMASLKKEAGQKGLVDETALADESRIKGELDKREEFLNRVRPQLAQQNNSQQLEEYEGDLARSKQLYKKIKDATDLAAKKANGVIEELDNRIQDFDEQIAQLEQDKGNQDTQDSTIQTQLNMAVTGIAQQRAQQFAGAFPGAGGPVVTSNINNRIGTTGGGTRSVPTAAGGGSLRPYLGGPATGLAALPGTASPFGSPVTQ